MSNRTQFVLTTQEIITPQGVIPESCVTYNTMEECRNAQQVLEDHGFIATYLVIGARDVRYMH